MSINNKFRALFQKFTVIFKTVTESATLKLDAFIFTKDQPPQIRALLAGTGAHLIISFEQVLNESQLLIRFSPEDRLIITKIIEDTSNIYHHLVNSTQIQIVSKTPDRVTKKVILTISATCLDKTIYFSADAAELSRNKFLLQFFNKADHFNIGYSAAESRIRSEKNEITSVSI